MGISIASVLWREEENIPLYFEGVKKLIEAGHVDNVVIVVQESPDKTWDLIWPMAQGRVNPWLGHVKKVPHMGFCEAHRQMSLEMAKNKWVLVLDADEWVEPDVPLSTLVDQAEREERVAITMPTYNHVVDLPGDKRMMHFGEERHFRLINREHVTWPENVHATPEVRGRWLDAPATMFVHHRWQLFAVPEKIARQVEFTRKQRGGAEAAKLKDYLEGHYAAFRRELGVVR